MKNRIGDAQLTIEFLDRYKALEIERRTFGHPTSLWTLPLAAEVAYVTGLLPRQVSGEAIRLALRRLGVSWRRAKRWITSPDPAYSRKKNSGTA